MNQRHLTETAYRRLCIMFSSWSPTSYRVINAQIHYIFNLAANCKSPFVKLTTDIYGGRDGIFDFTETCVQDCINFIQTLTFDTPAQLIDDDETLGVVRSANARLMNCRYFIKLLEAYDRIDLAKAHHIIAAHDVLLIESTQARRTAFLRDKIPENTTWDSVIEICDRYITAPIVDTTVGYRVGCNKRLLALCIKYIPPLRQQDYVSAYVLGTTPGTTVDYTVTPNTIDLSTGIYTIREYKTKNSFSKRYGSPDRVVELPKELIDTLLAIYKGVNSFMFITQHDQKYTDNGFYLFMKRYFGITSSQLRVLYTTYNVSELSANLNNNTAYIMGHTIATQRMDYMTKIE